MLKRTRTTVAAGLAAATVLVVAPLALAANGGSPSVPPRTASGLLADGRLVTFNTRSAASTRLVAAVTGLTGDSRLVGIDYRAKDGLLYGLGEKGGIYTLDGGTGAATFVARLTVTLSGTYFGVDFNPAAAAMRIISDTGQNLRHPFAAGAATATTVVDGGLSYTGVAAGGVTGAGYTNNDNDPSTPTQLFDVDTLKNQVALQLPPNSGSLNVTGPLPVDVGARAGFDIVTTLDDSGRAVDNHALATVLVDRRYHLYQVDVLSGGLLDLGGFRNGQQVVDLAVPTGR